MIFSFYSPHFHLQSSRSDNSPSFSGLPIDPEAYRGLSPKLLVVQYGYNCPIILCYNKKMRELLDQRISKRKYSKISLQKRVKLVRLVTEENQAVTKAAKKLSIKLCTARIILKKYKETGRFPMKNPRHRVIPRIQASCTPPLPHTIEPTPQQHHQEGLPKTSSFQGFSPVAKEEMVFNPYWLWYSNYCAFLAAEAAQYNF